MLFNYSSCTYDLLPREKALKYGVKSLTNEDLIALILKSGYKNHDVFCLTKDVLDKARGFKNLLTLSYEELISIKGINKAKALEIMAILEVAKRLCSVEEVNEEEINSPSKLVDYLRFNIGFSSQEEFYVIYLNSSGSIIKEDVLFKGSKNRSVVAIDEVIRQALLNKACAFVVSHNHPSGKVKPSKADIDITESLIKAGELMNIPLLDHIIVSKSDFYSFKQAGLL